MFRRLLKKKITITLVNDGDQVIVTSNLKNKLNPLTMTRQEDIAFSILQALRLDERVKKIKVKG